MKHGAMRWTAAVAVLCGAALVGGCGDSSGRQDLTGRWEGGLTLQLAGGNALGGRLTLRLDQAGSFASGGADWAPIGEVQGIAGPVDGIFVTLRLDFRCQGATEASARGTFQTTVLEGTVDGDALEIERASGTACTLGGPPAQVVGGSAALTRVADGVPL